MTEPERQRRRLRGVLAWEACWIPLEMAGTALGLFLGLRLDQWYAAGVCLFIVCFVSWGVRWRHYGGAA